MHQFLTSRLAPTLGQLTGPDTAAVPDLPPAPLHEAWLFENPLWLSLALVAIGVVVALMMLRLGKARLGLLGGGVAVLLGAGTFAAGHLVETPRETLAADTARLVQATATADAATMRELLHPDVTLRRGRARFIPEITGRESLLAIAGDRIPRAIGRVVVLETRAGLDGPNVARTQTRLRTLGPDGQLFGHSWWGLDWQQRDGTWTVVGIEPLWIQGG